MSTWTKLFLAVAMIALPVRAAWATQIELHAAVDRTGVSAWQGSGHPGTRFGEIIIWTHASRLLHRYRFEPATPNGEKISEDEVFGLTVGPKPFALRPLGTGPVGPAAK